MFRLFCGNEDVSRYVKSIKQTDKFAEYTIIGNAPSLEFDVALDNKSNYFNDKINETFKIYRDNELYATLEVYEAPEKVTVELKLVMYDSIVKTNVPYNTNTALYPMTIQRCIEEMKTLLGINIDYSELSSFVLDWSVNQWDNTVSIRQWLMWIAELDACNIYSLPDGTIKFKGIPLSYTHNIEIDSHVETFKTDAIFSVSKIKFDDGINPLSAGDDTANYVNIDENNMYVESKEQIDHIYDILNGFTFTSLTNLKMVSFDDLRTGDLIHYKEYFDVYVMECVTDIYNATYNVQNINGEMQSIDKQKVTEHFELNTKIKKIKVDMDHNKQELDVMVKHQEGTDSKIEELNISIDGLKNTITQQGGNNLIKDSMGVYGDGWQGKNYIDKSTGVKDRNIYGFGIMLANSELHQVISVPNGNYTLSFSYAKWIPLADVKMIVNGTEFVLSNNEFTSFIHSFEVNSGTVDITFISDTDYSCTIVNLMLNQGTEPMLWSLNSNETWTDTMKMSSSGLTIESSGADVLFNAKADIIGFKNKNTGEYVAIFTDNGAIMKELEVKVKAKIVGLLFQEINGQTVINRIGGDD